MTRVLVIGAGAMGRNHARVLRDLPGVDLVGVVDRERTVAEAVAASAATTAHDDYRAALSELRPDAVAVAVPTAEHCAVTMAALEAGVHVLVEKPIAATAEEATRMIAAAEHAGLILTVGHVERYNPALIELRRRLRESQLGRIFQAHARRMGPFPQRIRDVGVVVDLASHDLDAMRYVIGSEITRVFAETKREIHTSQEDLMSGLIRFADGTVGVLQTNWLTPTKIRELTVTGERGMFVVDYLTQDLFFYENAGFTGNSWEAMDVLRGVSEGTMVRYAVAKQEPLRNELTAFVAAVEGRPADLVTGEDGRRALLAALALVASGRSGEVTEVAT